MSGATFYLGGQKRLHIKVFKFTTFFGILHWIPATLNMCAICEMSFIELFYIEGWIHIDAKLVNLVLFPSH